MQTHPVDKLLEQHCYKSAAGLLQLVRFYVCIIPEKTRYSTTLLGQPIHDKRGELVCTKPFPSMPVCFWNDKGNAKYNNAYFAKYKGELLPCHF